MKPALIIGKAITVAVWAWAIAGSLGAPVPMAETGPMVALGLVAAHTVEVALFLPKLKGAGGTTMGHVVGLMIFGVFHYHGARAAK